MCKGKLYHVQSHQNDALSGRAVSTVIQSVMKNGYVEQCAEKGEYFLKTFKKIKNELAFVSEVRGRGLLLAVQLSDEYVEYGEDIQWKLKDKGYLMDFHKASSSFRFFPPFTITYEEIDEFTEAFKDSLISLNR